LDQSDSYAVEPYFLLDFTIEYPLKLGKVITQISLEVKNILDNYYENIQNRAMPGINFQLQLITKL
jgi:outer membrane cobalamin receptor